MNCYHCKHELVWETDHDISHEDEEFSTMSFLVCPMCGSEHHVYKLKEEQNNHDN